MIFILILLPIIILGFLIWAIIHGSKRVKIITAALIVVLVGLIFLPVCRLITPKYIEKTTQGGLEPSAYYALLDRGVELGGETNKKKQGQWYVCKKPFDSLKKVLKPIFRLHENEDKILIQDLKN